MKKEKYRILLVDDEEDILEVLSFNLRQEGYRVWEADTGEEALRLAPEIVPHLVLLDVMMPGMDGFETCRALRRQGETGEAVIVFLTARGEEYDQLEGFDAGGDDYLVKPVRIKVLLKRVAALLKRVSLFSENRAPSVLEAAGIRIDRKRYQVIRGDRSLTLPRKEFELLFLLASEPGKTFSREEIFARVWGEGVVVGDRTLDVHIRRLREKLGNQLIGTVKGVGYRLNG